MQHKEPLMSRGLDNLSNQQLRSGVCDAYSSAALQPEGKHPFPVGLEFAKSLGYPDELLASLPEVSVDAFAGVSNVSIFADIPENSTVLDLGCGAGMDSLIAARRAGPDGRVIGIDFSDAMLNRAREGRAIAGIGNALFCRADAEHLPLPDDSIDVALVNGIFNLNPARDIIFRELSRIVRDSGSVYAAELIISRPLPMEEQNQSNWFA
jgi:SAM-dependent methyltransferase